MANCLAPGYIKISYTSNAHSHVMTIPVNPEGTGDSILFVKKGGGTISPPDAMDAFLPLLEPLLADADSFDAYEVFTQADCSSAPVFQTSAVLDGFNGTSGSADKEWVQAVWTFRNAAGGRGKLQLMEQVAAQDQKISVGAAVSPVSEVFAYAISGDSFIYSRGNAYLASGINFVTKVNDELRRKFLHP